MTHDPGPTDQFCQALVRALAASAHLAVAGSMVLSIDLFLYGKKESGCP